MKLTRPGLQDLKLVERQRGGRLIIAVGAAIGVVVATAVILLMLGSTALAATATGGVAPTAVAPTGGPRIVGIACRTSCQSADGAAPGSVVRVRGRGLAHAARVVFLGRSGAGDDASAGTRRRDAKSGYVDVKVPARARSGPFMVLTREGTASQSSPSGLVVNRGTRQFSATGAVVGRGVEAQLEARTVFYGGQRGVRFTYTVKGRSTPVRVDLVRIDTGTLVGTWSVGSVPPDQPQSVAWAGGTAGGDARYQFQVYTGADAAPHAAAAAQAGGGLPNVEDSFLYLQHVFPIRGRHTYGSVDNRYGADRGDHSHGGQDVLAACGTPLVAVRGGTVLGAGYGGGGGNYVTIHTAGSSYDNVYMHLRDTPLVKEGQRVYTGQPIGFVGRTGAASTCHLHFELWQGAWFGGGRTVDPLASMHAWDRLS